MATGLFFGLTEGMQAFLLIAALIILSFFLIRHMAFYSRYRKIRKENMELARHLRKELKTRKSRTSSDFEDIPIMGSAGRIRIPASYEARIGKVKGKKASRATRQKPAKKPAAIRKRARDIASV